MKNFILITAMVFVLSFSARAQDAPTADDKVCLTQSEAADVFALAAKGKGYDTYVNKAEGDIKIRDEIITNLKIKLAQAVQDAINLSNQATRDNAALEQYRQYFFTKSRTKCIGVICLQIGK